MKKLRKKALALFLTAMMVVAMAPAAFAGTFSDVPADKSYAGAVERLAGLGVVKGYPDGTFGPDRTFTRAEAAAIAVRLRGISSAAGQGETQFKDVPADHWASGVINVAVGLGIIKGFPDGTFRPDEPVTHVQWLTMVLRVMGYGVVIDKNWSVSKVVGQAALLGLDKGVTITPNLPASRAEVAQIADNGLTKPLMVLSSVDADGNERYAPDNTKSIAATYLKTTTEPSSGTAMLTKSPEIFGTASDAATVGTTPVTLASGANYKGLLGHQVVAWKNADNKVFFFEDKTPASSIKKAKYDATNDKLTSGGTDLQMAANWKLFRNSQDTPTTNVLDGDGNNDNALDYVDNGEVTAILDNDGKVAAVIATESTTRIVDSVSTAFESIALKTVGGGSDSLSLKNKTVTWSGAASKLADLQKGDVIEYYSANVGGKDYVHIFVTRDTRTGDFTRLDAAGNKVTVGGTQYSEIANMPDTTGTSNTRNFDADAGLLGKAVKITLNRFGKVVAMESITAEAAKTIAVVWGAPWDTSNSGTPSIDNRGKVRVIKSDGTEAIYLIAKGATVDSNGDGDTVDATDISDYDPTKNEALEDPNNSQVDLEEANVQGTNLIEYTVNSSGEIDSITVLHDTAQMNEATALNVNKDNNTIEETDGGAILAVTSSTAIFEFVTDAAKGKVLSRSALMADSNGTVTAKVVRTKAGESLAKAIVITGDLNAPSADTYGLHVGEYTTSGSKYYFSILANGTTTDYEVSSTSYAAYAPDNVLKFNPSDVKGSVVGATAESVSDAVAYEWRVQEIDAANKIVYVDEYQKTTGAENPNDRRTGYLFGSKTQVFLLNGDAPATQGSFGDLAVGTKVDVYDENNDGVLEVIVIKN